MYAEERQREILERVMRDGKVSVESLTEAFGVSAPTIRADLGTLEGRRLLRRTHGGAIAVETTLYEPPYAERERARQTEKARIGALAAARIHDHETVILDAGTTTFEIAVRLKERIGLTVVTNSLEAAWELMDAPAGHIEIIVVGGNVHASRRATLGPLAAEFLGRLQVDRVFVGVNGVHADAGWTVVDFDAAQVKRAMMARAREVVVVADSSKIGAAAFASIGPLSLAHVLVTDAAIGHPAGDALIASGVEVLVAPED
jgi:DeoR/GlpR family transcriptional regulator of sugar metabolism